MSNKLTLKKADKFFLKDHDDFDEQWLRKVIEDDPSIIGLGDLELKEAKATHNSVFMPLWGLSLIINSFLKLNL
jgi:hypothetical protein